MAAESAVSGWSITFPESLWSRLQEHLFPGDDDEHGAVVAAGISRGPGGLRLLAREVFVAEDGVDYVPGTRGYRRLEPHFVRDRMLACRDEKLAYLAVHNHGGTGSVGFSSDDFGSHERGYPALLDIGRGVPVGALVLAKAAIAGDLWLPGGERLVLDRATVVGRRILHYGPGSERQSTPAALRFDRQARLFGDTGQAILKDLRVGIIGCGGIGMLLVEYLSRLGVGHLVVIDPDRVDPTNLPRLPGASRRDTGWFADERWPARLRAWGKRHARPKVDVARRLAREAHPDVDVEAIFGDVLEAANAARFTDVDYLFLAADTMQARLLVNAIVHQFLVPGVQLGSKVSLSASTGEVLDVHSVVRPVTPDQGCLWCNELISPQRLAEESLSERDRLAQRYVDDPAVAAPSVITLNAVAAAHAATDFLFAVTGLVKPDAAGDYLRGRPMVRDVRWDRPRRDPDCPECGRQPDSRFARGDGSALPVRVRMPRP
jgi:ThiF family